MSAQGDQNVQIQHVAGSTITVTFGGRPPREVPLSPATVPVPEQARSPARLLRARSGVIGYSARDDLLQELRAWATSDLSFGAVLIGGGGGSGKTRLGVEMCERQHAEGWLTGLLKPEADAEALETLLHAPIARLVVIDYAEARVEQLKVILPLLAARATSTAPVRVMLLVRDQPRSGDWDQALRNRDDALDAVLDEIEMRALNDLPLDFDDRKTLFEHAVQALARRTAITCDSSLPTDLKDAVFESPLLVVIAAYLRVHGEADIPASKTALIDELLQHESRYWRATAEAGDRDDELLRRVVALSTLAGAASEHDAAKLLRLVPDLVDASEERRRRLARWVYRAYPGPRYWNALEPDLIAEHLVAQCYEHAPEVLSGVLDRDDLADVIHPLTFYARAAKDSEGLRRALEEPISTRLAQLTTLAIRQAASEKQLDLLLGVPTIASLLTRLLEVTPVDLEAAMASADLLPEGQNLILSSLGLQLSSTIVEELRSGAADGALSRAFLPAALTNISNYLSEAGDRIQALAPIQEAVGLYRQLATDNPAFTPSLAISLNNLSNRLSEAGDRVQALTAIQEAVTIRRQLATDNPAAFTPELAISLNNLAIRLGEAGDRVQALTAIQEAVGLYRQLATDNPAAFTPSLAGSLNNLAIRLGEAGDHKQALTAIQEAVTIRRHLATDNPAAFTPSLARSLNNLAFFLNETGNPEQATRVLEEATTLIPRDAG
jgi:tetratricopeptide (TPR) repeat protein